MKVNLVIYVLIEKSFKTRHTFVVKTGFGDAAFWNLAQSLSRAAWHAHYSDMPFASTLRNFICMIKMMWIIFSLYLPFEELGIKNIYPDFFSGGGAGEGVVATLYPFFILAKIAIRSTYLLCVQIPTYLQQNTDSKGLVVKRCFSNPPPRPE